MKQQLHAVIGTAGHIDHGKTMLVTALTGKNTDRLREEQERGITIDIDFAPLVFPDGTIAGVVDVPGHERFVRNMVAGAAGIDAALIVVDVNEGMMPQTYEHLAILELLGIHEGVVALTKVDLADPELVEVAKELVVEALSQTSFKGSPIVSTSVKTGQGLEELRQQLYELVLRCDKRDSGGAFRLPVDKVFSVPGFGTVVSGTIWRGQIQTGNEVEVLPGRRPARVRGLQIHGESMTTSVAGTRTALNLTGIEKDEVYRGAVVVAPGTLTETDLVDAKIHLLPNSPWSLKHRSRVHLHLGTAEAIGTLLLLDGDELQPGEEALVQVKLDRTLVADTFDRFIIRSYSPVTTIGGGHVINPAPPRLHRRKRDDILAMLVSQDSDSPYQRLLILLSQGAPRTDDQITTSLSLSKAESAALLLEAEGAGDITRLPSGWLASRRIEDVLSEVEQALWNTHEKQRFLLWVSRASLLSAVEAVFRQRDALWILEEGVRRNLWQMQGTGIRAKDWVVEFSSEEKLILETLLRAIENAGLQPVSTSDVVAQFPKRDRVAAQLLQHASQLGDIVEVSDGFWLSKQVLDSVKETLRNLFETSGPFTVAAVRDALSSNRKVTLMLLEHLDSVKVTTRRGDFRVYNQRQEETSS